MTGLVAPALDREDLTRQLEAAWARSDRIFAQIAEGGWHARPIPLRHPCIFYLGHLPAFAWNQVGRGLLGRGDLHLTFDRLFERGIDPLGDEAAAADAEVAAWPRLGEIVAYRDEARHALRESFDAVTALAGKDVLAEKGRIFHLVLEHELMHHETLQYILQQMPYDAKRAPANGGHVRTGSARAAARMRVPGGVATLGARFDEIPFGWDNEFEAHRVEVPAFVIDSLPVTVAAYREFVDAGGYDREDLWGSADWRWVKAAGRTHPVDWFSDGAARRFRTAHAAVDLDAVGGWPVHVSLAEARAFARWRGAALPTEAQLHRAAYGTPEGVERRYPWGADEPAPRFGNFDFHETGPLPVGSTPEGASAWGVEELVGNGWEWTGTPFAPHPGFGPWARTYPGYSADFFDDAHFVVFGASWATDRKLLRRSLRNWYQAHYPYVFATFRLVWPAV